MWVNMNDLCASLFCLNYVGKSDRVSLRHIAAHDQDAIAIDKILRKSRSAATTECGAQTGHSGTVSYTGLVLDGDYTQATIKELFDDIVLFDIQGCTTERGNT